ncbi:protein translocase subunit SecF [Ilumatobacter sp.]|uniref:protein translocase subunit SecF n=1 Tax=Ilumatobacter sp. TaxID=1967498 RepID=UPI003AF95D4D
MTGTMRDVTAIDRPPIKSSALGRLFEGQTSIDFVGKRKVGAAISGALLIATLISLLTQGLNLGIDFEGGISWDVPAAEFTVEDAEDVLGDAGVSTEGARLQERSSESGAFIKVQVGDQPEEVGAALRADFAAAANVPLDEVNVNLVSSSWGAEITTKALEALAIFIVIVAIFIAIRFEWRMALAAIVAMVHDVLISVGIYSIFQFIVTPPTVIAFLTILGYSLYDTIVVFDRVKENEAKYAAQKPPYDDVINVSMNQVLMRSLTTSFSSIVPVISLLLIGAGVLGQSTLAEFALALFVGMVTGAYSSIFVAAALLGVLKRSDASWEGRNIDRAVGDALRDMVMGGNVGSRKTRSDAAKGRRKPTGTAPVAARGDDGDAARGSDPKGAPKSATATEAKQVLSHPPRPRKKKRR